MSELGLRQLDQVPDGFLDIAAENLYQIMPEPTLIHLPGRQARPLFISVLQHGNETTGLLAVQKLLRAHRKGNGYLLPRSISLFVGNVVAARCYARRLDDQPDYNRIWPGTDAPESIERRVMAEVLEEMRRRDPFLSIDIHNNTGINPHYACVNRLDHRFFHLATLFSRTVVYFIRPRGVQSMAFAELCPAVTLECGQAGQSHSIEHALEYLDACLHLATLPAHAVAEHDIDLFHTMAQVKVPEELTFSFVSEAADIQFAADLDHLNFREIPEGTVLGWGQCVGDRPLEVIDEQGNDVWERYFICADNEIRTRIPLMPAMLTLNTKVIRQDCLCYLMERMPLPDMAGD